MQLPVCRELVKFNSNIALALYMMVPCSSRLAWESAMLGEHGLLLFDRTVERGTAHQRVCLRMVGRSEIDPYRRHDVCSHSQDLATMSL
jgi:hypothetical protein